MIELRLEGLEGALEVRGFTIHEGLSSLYAITIDARSRDEDLDLEALAGKLARFRVERNGKERVYLGVVRAIEHVRAEPDGLSTYALSIAPPLYLLTQRTNYRVFQHRTAPEIVKTILDEWGIESAFAIDEKKYPQLDYRVQYGESDFDFVSRLLEDAGIAYVLRNSADGPLILFGDDLGAIEAHAAGAIAFVDDAAIAARGDRVTAVRVTSE